MQEENMVAYGRRDDNALTVAGLISAATVYPAPSFPDAAQ
jgi:hypothetical protein